MNFEAGDTVGVDWEVVEEILPVNAKFMIPIWSEKMEAGRIRNQSEKLSYSDDNWWVVVSLQGKSNTLPEESLYHACLECESEKVYNQRREEWMCPFCGNHD